MSAWQFLVVCVIGVVALFAATGVIHFHVSIKPDKEKIKEAHLNSPPRLWLLALVVGLIVGYGLRWAFW